MLIQYITNDWKIHWLKRVGTLKNIQLLNLLKSNYFRFNLNFLVTTLIYKNQECPQIKTSFKLGLRTFEYCCAHWRALESKWLRNTGLNQSYIFTETPSIYKVLKMYLATESQASGGCVGSSHLQSWYTPPHRSCHIQQPPPENNSQYSASPPSTIFIKNPDT